MADPTYPPDQGPRNLSVMFHGLRRVVEGLADTISRRSVTRQVWNATIRSHLLGGESAAAPTFVAVPGALTGDFEYAYSFSSDYLHGETNLSPVLTTGAVAANQIDLTGARSTDPQMTDVNIYRRDTGEGDLDWRLVATIANPAAGSWTYSDNAEIVDLLSQPNPLTFYCPLWVVCGPGYELQRVKVKPEGGELVADPDNYWMLWLLRRKQNQQWPERISRTQDTTLSGMSTTGIWNPFVTSEAGPPRVDLGFPMLENDTLYLGLRGVGAEVPPLPELSCQVDATRKEV
jgi:hypothetical protein